MARDKYPKLIQIPVTEEFHQAWKVWCTIRKVDMGVVGRKALEAFAKDNQIISTKTRESKPEPESDRQALHVSSAL